MIRCANPACRRPLDPERVINYGAKTCDAACRAAAWKARTGYGRQTGRKGRANARQPRRRTPDLRVSYRKAVDVLAGELERHGLVNPPGTGRVVAETWLLEALPPGQRDALARAREERT